MSTLTQALTWDPDRTRRRPADALLFARVSRPLRVAAMLARGLARAIYRLYVPTW